MKSYKGLVMAHDWVLVRKFERISLSTGGIVMPGQEGEAGALALAVGPGLAFQNEKGRQPMHIKVGEIALGRGEMMPVMHEGEQLAMIRDGGIMATEEPTAEERKLIEQTGGSAPRIVLPKFELPS